MIKIAAAALGITFLLLGILGFIPGVTTTGGDGMPLLLDMFTVGSIHNVIHIISGAVGLIAASSTGYARWYLQIFGLAYAFVAAIGFVQGDTVLGLVTVNFADNILHTVLAVLLLVVGYWLNGDEGSNIAPPIRRAM